MAAAAAVTASALRLQQRMLMRRRLPLRLQALGRRAAAPEAAASQRPLGRAPVLLPLSLRLRASQQVPLQRMRSCPPLAARRLAAPVAIKHMFIKTFLFIRHRSGARQHQNFNKISYNLIET